MIYLIDDKIQRQTSYGWSESKIEKFNQYLFPVYTYEQILEGNLRDKIFVPGNIVLFHESFFDATSNKHAKDSIVIRSELEKYSNQNSDFSVAFFSGSKNSRSHEKNVVNLPVGTLYENLEYFVQNYSEGKIDLRYLLFGENPEIEEYLFRSYEEGNQNLDDLENYSSNAANLYIRPHQNFIQKPIPTFDEQTLFHKVSDSELNDKILNWMNQKVYDNIFIPLCFGPVLSDYNGLRLAMHLRTTKTLCQFSNIFIYGTVDHSYLLQNECYDIFKTKNVHLINYKRSSFKDSLLSEVNPFSPNDLSRELEKINLNAPKNYEDSHSISNEWAILRWFNALSASGIIDYIPDEIESIQDKVNSNLYYKFLSSRFRMDNSIRLDLDKIKLGFNGSILYIDDEKEKGWNELFCTLLHDGIVNKVKKFESIGEEFHGMETNEIVVSTVNKAKSFDLVVLDFRLTQTDFNETDPRKITGFKILEGIKKHNKGIQVIVFSATNKVWNIQALQAAGADGFILKESVENSVEANFTKNSLENMMITINTGLSLSFLKTLHAYIQEVKDYFDANSQEFNSVTRKFECIYSRFQNEVYNQLLIAFECLSNSRKNQKKNEFNQKYVDLALISVYKIMELFNSKYINDHSLIVNGFNGRLLNGDHPSTLDKFAYVVQVNFEMELITIIGFLEMYNDMRNDIIHPKRKGRQRKSLPQDLINFVQIMKTFILRSD